MSSGKPILLSQSASSDLSWQSISPLHRKCASMHCPFSHWNWDAEHMGQLSSSLWSSHSGNPSHRHAIGIQSISPVAHVNWSGEQVGGSGERENRSELYTQFYPFQQNKSMRAFFKKSTLIPSLEFFCDYAKILAKRKTWFCIGNEILPTS